ncbi:hypothetical protein IscW_ISCW001774 [Ixodes scapularis]|uniref:Uncharacterized protein n=1 Tax=Ixodes scapularis TaxID=6945 RepID=B7P1Y1_IXOSC|nr:hypothetical protein IscW_ISCW001774 [Ixodes scapularis]|eukprot:XP_002433539.1 hypothetical protein IscW_ISCW001774 [Ixodes scapularis]
MKALQFYPDSPSTAADYSFGQPCTSVNYRDMLSLCSENEDFKGSYDQSMMTNRAVLPLNQSVIVYDTPQTIKRKMCAITRAFPEYHLGIALYDIDYEDTEKLCTNKKNLNDASGYWRVEPSSAYMKTILANVSFYTENQPCP